MENKKNDFLGLLVSRLHSKRKIDYTHTLANHTAGPSITD